MRNGIIIFLVKKAAKVALLEDGDKINEENNFGTIPEKKGFFKKIFSRSDRENNNLNRGFLFFLEKGYIKNHKEYLFVTEVKHE